MRSQQSTTIVIGSSRRRRRAGSVLVWCAILLPVLIAMVGLVIDGGLMLAAYREGQNAADAAALAAAMDLMNPQTSGQAAVTAVTFVTDPAHNNLANATVAVHIPPSRGPYAGLSRYAEAIVTCPLTTHFIQVLPGFNRNQSVTARAVAGVELLSIDEGVMALNPTGTGLRTVGNATLKVEGGILVNSSDGEAAIAGKNGIWATEVDVVGNVKNPTDFRNIDPSNPSSPLHTNTMPFPDRFSYLPTPTSANGVGSAQTIPSDGQYQPGVYTEDIKITGASNVTFAPGIYVMKGASVSIGGTGTVTGQGVMFYFTGSDYTTSGAPDSSDPIDPFNQSPPTSNATFGTLTIDGTANVILTPIDDANSPFDGMLFYYRRANAEEMKITGDTEHNQLTGTIYDKYGTLTLNGNGTYGAQFIVGSANITGNGSITINYIGGNPGKAPRVFLVE